LPLNIFDPRYLAMVDAALSGPRLIGMVQPALDASEHSGRRRSATWAASGG
jgi:Lon protease-like protein